jgi:hypothetical protein
MALDDAPDPKLRFVFTGQTNAKVSWWLNAPRDGFIKRAEQEAHRMSLNRESAWVAGMSSDKGLPPSTPSKAKVFLQGTTS